MTLNEYQVEAASTAKYPEGMKILYPVLGLCGETGEVAEKVKKVFRDKNGEFSLETKEEIKKELGDVLWYLSATARDLGCTLEEVAEMNLAKLRSRQERGVIHGNGDNR